MESIDNANTTADTIATRLGTLRADLWRWMDRVDNYGDRPLHHEWRERIGAVWEDVQELEEQLDTLRGELEEIPEEIAAMENDDDE